MVRKSVNNKSVISKSVIKSDATSILKSDAVGVSSSPKIEVKTEMKTEVNIANIAHSVIVQPAISIGMVGHVDHGKTTLVQALSGRWTDTHSEEIKRGITIRLGYADVSIFKCVNCTGDSAYGNSELCPVCNSPRAFVRKISLVDAPGHESLMATMLSGANIMDGALLLVSAHEPCPQPQTKEHLVALQIVGIKNIIVVQNKIDLVSEEQALKNYEQIKLFLKGTPYENSFIVPVSAKHNANIDVLLSTIEQVFPTPVRDFSNSPLFFVARSFDINKPGTSSDKLRGGVLGGALRQGKLSVGDDIVILPGYCVEEKNQKVWKPLLTKIESLMCGNISVESIIPGGSSGILTQLDPSIIAGDQLVGSVVGHPKSVPPVWPSLFLNIHLLERAVGVKDELIIEPIKLNEMLMLNVNSAATVGVVKELKKEAIRCELRRPVCAEKGSRVTISRSVGQRWRLIGYGEIKK